MEEGINNTANEIIRCVKEWKKRHAWNKNNNYVEKLKIKKKEDNFKVEEENI